MVPETGSTNADLLARLAGGEVIPEGSWLIADRQVQGRGRQGRHWLDAPGNFMGSTVVHGQAGDPVPASLSFVAALALYETLCSHVPDPAQLRLKWPNDVLLSDTKLCGILLEREGRHTVVGIGVNLAKAPQTADRATISLADKGARADRDLFAQDLACQFETELARWRETGTGQLFRRWLAAAHVEGTRLTVHDEQGKTITGSFLGLEPDGALRLQLEDGTPHVVYAGEVVWERS
ncbi:biotin--[acetyl-CoA-carboxylase] ligase [Alteraurantiacibacter aquimixticola]|uniref:biotin--[biotin carboxyl-carrier protein] ligase n=1 Tax=Alteraurantiacibacter aquimixticola TaxID=2489173 RepID=A0A4V4U8P7_9SPHN|nr:biotin--[acetyl-CoA-carboxylase] ligase [Alteraurantiacibacter aquimixticola]